MWKHNQLCNIVKSFQFLPVECKQNKKNLSGVAHLREHRDLRQRPVAGAVSPAGARAQGGTPYCGAEAAGSAVPAAAGRGLLRPGVCRQVCSSSFSPNFRNFGEFQLIYFSSLNFKDIFNMAPRISIYFIIIYIFRDEASRARRIFWFKKTCRFFDRIGKLFWLPLL